MYLTPNKIEHRTVILAVLQFASWDRIDGTWEIIAPLPHNLKVEVLNNENTHDVACEFKQFAEQNGVAFNSLCSEEVNGKHYFHINGASLSL